MKNISISLTAIKIEWHWWFIKKERKLGNAFLSRGHSLSSKRMLILNARLSKHSVKAMRAQQIYMGMVETGTPPFSHINPSA